MSNPTITPKGWEKSDYQKTELTTEGKVVKDVVKVRSQSQGLSSAGRNVKIRSAKAGNLSE